MAGGPMIHYQGLENLVPPELLVMITQPIADTILADIAAKARFEWIRLAGLYLNSTRRDYIAGIQAPEITPGQAVIGLVGAVPNIVENGMARTDMRDTLLGPTVPTVPLGQRGKHESEDGRSLFRAIPFRHATPGAGQAVGMPMGQAYGGAEGKRLGQKVYRAAKQLKPSTSMPGKGTEWGERLEEGLAPVLKPYHSGDIYAGMVKMRKQYKSAEQSQYATFRTISTNSAPQKWIRMNTRPGKQIARRVNEYVSRIAGKSFVDYVEGLAG